MSGEHPVTSSPPQNCRVLVSGGNPERLPWRGSWTYVWKTRPERARGGAGGRGHDETATPCSQQVGHQTGERGPPHMGVFPAPCEWSFLLTPEGVELCPSQCLDCVTTLHAGSMKRHKDFLLLTWNSDCSLEPSAHLQIRKRAGCTSIQVPRRGLSTPSMWDPCSPGPLA